MAASPVPASPLDNEIAQMREQIESLERRRSVLSATLLSSENTLARIRRANARPGSASSSAAAASVVAEKQQRHNLENVHRTCAGVTAFRVKDPDPYAVDSGKILGVRVEVSVKENGDLRIHKHTIPPCIPLQALAAKYLPQTSPLSIDGSTQQSRSQDLHRLVRELRKGLVSYHLRLDAIAKLRSHAGLPEHVNESSGKRKRSKAGIADVRALGVDAREIEIRWTDSSTARVLLSKRGIIERIVARSPDGNTRMKNIERKVMSGDGRVEGLVERLTPSEVV